MKLLLFLITAALTLGVATSSTALAGQGSGYSSRVSHRCGSCGAGVYQVRYVCGYQRDGCSIYRWRTASHSCRPRYDRGGHGGHDSHSDRGRHGSHRGHGR